MYKCKPPKLTIQHLLCTVHLCTFNTCTFNTVIVPPSPQPQGMRSSMSSYARQRSCRRIHSHTPRISASTTTTTTTTVKHVKSDVSDDKPTSIYGPAIRTLPKGEKKENISHLHEENRIVQAREMTSQNPSSSPFAFSPFFLFTFTSHHHRWLSSWYSPSFSSHGFGLRM